MNNNKNYIVEIDNDELACLILEAMGGAERPVGASAKEAMGMMLAADPRSYRICMNAAAAAVKYISQCVDEARPVQ